ncbi:MAG: hypothetical protein ABGY11_06130 [Candidatus Thioglobus sp.]|jgi:hypothetical protein
MRLKILIITLLISWNAIAEEKTWFCTTEKRGGLIYRDSGAWEATTFTPARMTVKQNDMTLSFSEPFKGFIKRCEPLFTHTYKDTIQCAGSSKTFILNTTTGLATSSQIWGWISGSLDSDYDTLSTSLWRCEPF